MRSSRREFLTHLAVSAGAVPHAVAFGSAQEPSFRGGKAGDERLVDGISLCWCPPGRFRMGSPSTERGRRPDEAQVDVLLTRGFWTAKHEVT
jgi:formylglycine-generating enzyme required for sulfatase activity